MELTNIDIWKTWVLGSMLNFTRFFFKERYGRRFVVGQHHIRIAAALDRVLRGQCTRLIINIAPRYGKTELAVKSFIACGMALNPESKFIHLSYSADLARDNSRDVQAIVRLPKYARLFPGTRPSTTNAGSWRNDRGGGLYAVSSSGQVTGFGAGLVDRDDNDLMDAVSELDGQQPADETFGGAIVIDDPIKPDDARSDLVREKTNKKFETTIRNRVNSRRTPIIIIMQRLDDNDLCGYLQKLEPDEWEVLSLPCIFTGEDGKEQALWPFKHTIEELYRIRENDPWVFDTQYMQNPRPLEGLMYPKPWKTYQTMPVTARKVRKNYTDTADTGSDYLCSIDYVETEVGNFITNVLFTDRAMEYTETATARMLTEDNIDVAVVESNNGGRGFARNVERNCRLLHNTHTQISTMTQTKNKQVRIFSHSADVQNMTWFPEGWERRWPTFHNALAGYKKEGGNEHDDAPDALTGCFEQRGGIGGNADKVAAFLGR